MNAVMNATKSKSTATKPMTSKAMLSDANLARWAKQVSQNLKRRGETLAVAESCTGGFLAKVLTDLPGSSEWFLGGWVVYSNDAKQRDAKVSAHILKRHGAVSEPVVVQLARGALTRFESHWSVAISGVAGPSGGSKAKPVGSVWLALGNRRGSRQTVDTYWCRFEGTRDQIRRHSVLIALQGLAAQTSAPVRAQKSA
jgi:nicotinamide-nucleotide amidase